MLLDIQGAMNAIKNTINELEKLLDEENAQLNRDKTELESQIEKMKCCENCKHINDDNFDYYCEDCKRFANETNIEKWESAE